MTFSSGPSPTQTSIQTVLRSFLLSILPDGTEVIASQINRVPEPKPQNFVLMTPLRQKRFATNIDDYADTAFTGSIAATVMTVTEIQIGEIVSGTTVFGDGIATGTKVVAQLTGPAGGIGTYTVSLAQNIGSRTLASGIQTHEQKTEVTYQLDIHGPAGFDNSQVIATLFRDEYATQFFTDAELDGAPLYAGEPRQMPFVNGEQQYEDRWTLDVVMQANITIITPQQFANTLTPDVISVDERYPP